MFLAHIKSICKWKSQYWIQMNEWGSWNFGFKYFSTCKFHLWFELFWNYKFDFRLGFFCWSRFYCNQPINLANNEMTFKDWIQYCYFVLIIVLLFTVVGIVVTIFQLIRSTAFFKLDYSSNMQYVDVAIHHHPYTPSGSSLLLGVGWKMLNHFLSEQRKPPWNLY